MGADEYFSDLLGSLGKSVGIESSNELREQSHNDIS